MRPLCIDLFCGLGGWTEGFLSEGYNVIGFDLERHIYGEHRYPAQLVLQDVLTLHGSQLRDAACIVASPPCQKYSYMAMPWKRAKAMAAWYREDSERIAELNQLFDACFRLQREASEAAGHHIPLIVENVKGAQPWVGRAAWHFGSFYLWGDVPALMPSANGVRKLPSEISESICQGVSPARWTNPNEHYFGRKVPGMNFHDYEKTGKPGRSFQSEAVKVPGLDWSKYGQPDYKAHGFNVVAAQRYQEGVKVASESGRHTDIEGTKGVKQHGSGPVWFDTGIAKHSSRSDSRKAASALIAKIPFTLAQHVARCFRPEVHQ
jgi:hypothetical protein